MTTGRGRVSWALFDWANQPFFTVVTTFIFAPYFAAEVVGDPVAGQALWGTIQGVAGLVIAVAAPVLGAMADATGPKKPWILAFQLLTVAGCVALWWAFPGRPESVVLVVVAMIVATIGAEFSIVFNNALLPSLVRAEAVGRLSGLGWAMGYAGGLVALALVLAAGRPQLFGLGSADGGPLFGLDAATFAVERATGPVSALWLIVFVLPMVLFTPDHAATGRRGMAALGQGLRQIGETLRRLSRYRNLALYLAAFMIYNNGLAAVIAFGGIYAKGIFGWSTTALGLFGILLTVFATLGALVGGRLDDRLGSRRTIALAILGVAAASLGLLSITADAILFVVPVAPMAPGGGLFATPQERAFLAFALVLGVCMGPMQAASRTMVARLAPADMVAEFYGLFALSGKATAFVAPFAVALATAYFASQRAALVVVLVFLVAGYALLRRVREERAPGLAPIPHAPKMR